jgi:uncharacterized protein (TIGR02996 family)
LILFRWKSKCRSPQPGEGINDRGTGVSCHESDAIDPASALLLPPSERLKLFVFFELEHSMIEERVLQAINARPDDDGPRIAYARILAARGDPRAEFIRVQLARARLSPHHPRRPTLIRREHALYAANRRAWTRALGRGVHVSWYDRGFPAELNLPAELFLRRGVRILQQFPPCAVLLTAVRPHLSALVSSPLLTRIVGLSVPGSLDDGEMATLISSPQLSDIRSLRLSYNLLGPESIAALITSPFTHLSTLGLEHTWLDDPEACALASSHVLDHVSTLHLSENHIGDAGVTALANSAHLQSVCRLELGHNRIRDEGARALATSPFLAGLRELDLWWNVIRDPGALALANSSVLTELHDLYLAENPVTEVGMRAVRTAPLGSRIRFDANTELVLARQGLPIATGCLIRSADRRGVPRRVAPVRRPRRRSTS